MDFVEAAEPTQPRRSQGRTLLVTLGFVLLAGMFLRLPTALFDTPGAPLAVLRPLHPKPSYPTIGFDEDLYRKYVEHLDKVGLSSYPEIVDHYRKFQQTLAGSILPPLRFLYILAGYLWHNLFGIDALVALTCVASFFSMLTLGLAVVLAWRMKGLAFATVIAALTAFAPTQLHMSQHALVDGFFTFWALLALWLLWENLQAPRSWKWLGPYVVALALMVLTKENSFFVWVALVALMAANRWFRFGIVTRELLVATVLGPLLGVAVLVFLAGGVGDMIATYQLSISKNYTLKYAILTGDGPWHRYLVDLLLVSPFILLLALGGAFGLRRDDRVGWYFAGFIAASYLVMCNVKYGMNLRYANMWDVPLRILAAGAILGLASKLTRYRQVAIVAAVTLVCLVEFRQYLILFVDYPLYELVSEGLLRALRILK
ncbi:MAG TPA: phospholipid carrier-dependent glycosyltransferase [Chthoniobacterales bacterium]|nr:phospholipid carrier-dependent glycosyltransferase [Chthoniobacterales bacterium]